MAFPFFPPLVVTFLHSNMCVCRDLEISFEKSCSSFHPFEISDLCLMIVIVIGNQPGTCLDLVDHGI